MERTYSNERMENETVYLIFGQNVKAYRKKRGHTQEELAATLDCDQKYVSRLENGYARPTLDICLRIANFLQVSIDNLLEGAYVFRCSSDGAKRQCRRQMLAEIGEVISKSTGEEERVSRPDICAQEIPSVRIENRLCAYRTGGSAVSIYTAAWSFSQRTVA